jgi:hypothetical protein
MRRLASLLFLVLAMTVSIYLFGQTDVYFAQSAAGTGNGSSCANARALSSHGVGDDVAGTTIHLCGTINVTANTNAFTALASGTSGSPITLKWEANAILQAPFWPGNNTINSGLAAVVISRSNWIVDGGSNGILQATANGSTLANQRASNGVFSAGATNLIVRNLTIQNLYIHSLITDETVSELGQLALGVNLVNCTNCRVTNNTIHDVLDGVYIVSTAPNGLTNLEIDHNTIYNINIGLDGGAAAPNSISGLYAHDNSIGSMVNWDDNLDNNHHNHIHWFASGSGASIGNVFVYNNLFIGDPGIHMTAPVNLEPDNNGIYVLPVAVFNNVRRNDSPTCSHTNTAYSDMATVVSGHMVVNNTLIGPGTCQNPINAGLGSERNGGTERNNIVDNYGYAHSMNSAVTTWTVSNNIYGRSGTFAAQHTSPFSTFNFAGWQSLTGGDAAPPSVNQGTAIAVQTSAPWRPLPGSPAINAGFNLFSTCNGQPIPGLGALCFDINGVQRPSVGNWDAGAAQSSSAVAPNAPTNLIGSVGGSTANFSWTASSGIPTPTAYTLYRATVHGGPYTAVKSGLTSTSTTDTPPNGTWFYVVASYVGGIVSSVSGNGTTATVTCTATCAFPTGTTFLIGGNSLFNGTFTSTGQPTASTFTFSSATSGTGTGGGTWRSGLESAKSNEVQLTVPAALTVSLLPASRTFANQLVGTTSATQVVTLTNTSGAGNTVTISGKGISTGANPGDFGQTNNCPSLLLSGTSCTFNVSFTPTAAGSRSANLTVTDNATGSPQAVTLSGTGVALSPGVSLNPTTLNFGDQTLSTTSTTRSIILTNTGSGTLTISSVVASGDFAAVTVPVTNCGGTVASLATCSINVTFTPTATGGRTGAITVTDNASGSPHVATLSGNGITTKCQVTGLVTLSGAAGVCQ